MRPNPTDSGDPYGGDRLSPRTPSSALLQVTPLDQGRAALLALTLTLSPSPHPKPRPDQVTLDQGRPALDAVIAALHEMLRRMPSAGAAFHELEHHCGGVTLT